MDENSLSSLFCEGTPGADATPEQRNEPEPQESQEPPKNGNLPHYVQDPVVLLPLTNASHRPTSTLKLEYTASLPEYPETDPYGFTYVVYVGGQDTSSISKLMHEFFQVPSVTIPEWLCLSTTQTGLQATDLPTRCGMPPTPSPFQDVQGQTDPCIRCVNSPSDPSGHYWKRVHEIPSFDLKTAQEVFGLDASLYLDNCDMVYSTTTRLTSCKIPHLPGAGKLQEQPCDVIFQVMIPYDIQARPYILFVSHGVHQHMPPMPVRAPPLLTERTIQLIAKTKSSNNKLPAFLKPPAIEASCAAEYSDLSISDIRKRITTGNPLTAALERQKLLRYLGTHYYLTTLLELDRDDSAKEYIQEVHQDNDGVMIICALKEQLDILLSAKEFEVHIKARQLRQDKLYEVVFAVCQEAGGFGQMALPLDMTDRFASIIFIVLGIGQFSLIWSETSILPHFLKTVTEVVGTRVSNVMLWDQMAGIMDCSSKQQFERMSELLIGTSSSGSRTLCWMLTVDLGSTNEKVAQWAQNTKDPVIAAGLNVHFSSMPSALYISFRRRKTAAEEMHIGDHLQHIRSLLPTIKWSWNEDKTIMGRYQSCVTAGRPPAPEPTIISYPANPPQPQAPPQRTTIPPPAATPQSTTLPQQINSEGPSKRKHSEVESSSPSVEIDNGPINIPSDDTPARDVPQLGTLPSRSDSLVRNWLESTNVSEEERREDERIQLKLMELRIKKKRNEAIEYELKAKRLRMELEQDEKDFQRAKEQSRYWKDLPLDADKT
ncbi:hypothetical protein T310_8101 [Rasamsonia emersonii CBS 393.64]|uniref:Uncharacterized protein n=1 Tax=Rasamsonia emersonii (strain ATCC 16479 / CBS 393.64 / IMI 116815) TaxID=1408163 RepID=A0A0F4YIK4_RASE3|nr:hypothetical protein T310_8101 [Rasamsonia emersonii CBS 393.64]KKA17955.1 hypothetical protein T310_8101 [Rasamsonia emersonii CBS 393.64]